MILIDKIRRIIDTNDKKRLLSNFISLSALQAVTYILPLLTMPYLVRVLGVGRYGKVMFAQAFVMYFVVLVDYGFTLSATREVSIHRDDKEKLTQIYSSVMIIKAVLIAVSFCILLLVVFSFDKFRCDWKLHFFTFGLVIGQALFPVWYFQGVERMKYITIINILSKVIFTILIFVVIRTPEDYFFVPVVNSLGMIVAALLSLWIIHKQFGQIFAFQKIAIIVGHFKESTQFFLSRVSLSLYTASNVFVLGLILNTTMVGYYSIAETLYKGLQSLYSPIVTTLYPYVAKQKNISLFKKIFTFTVIGNVAVIAILAISAKTLFALLFGVGYTLSSVYVFYILLIASLVVVPSIMMGYPFLAALGHPNEANRSIIIGSTAHLIGLCLLVILDALTIFTVSCMVVVTESIVISLRIYSIRRYKLWQNA